MNAELALLHPYPFQKLASLLEGCAPPSHLSPIPLSIGEPKHAAPGFVLDALNAHRDGYSVYPKTAGGDALRDAIARWLTQRFKLRSGLLQATRHILPVNGTREALFAFAQCVVNRTPEAGVALPNPFYQIYEGATLLAGATPLYLPERTDRPGICDFAAVSEADWVRCQLLYVCSPGNPTGAVLTLDDWAQLFDIADRHDLIIASDECYSELYFDEAAPPVGILEACQQLDRTDFRRCIAFHSLSKRSSLPGLRSGFVAGDAEVLEAFLLYRTYHGCAMSLPVQQASIAAWNDEVHVRENRRLYREKFDTVLSILDGCLDVSRPEAGFYLWAKTPADECEFTRALYDQTAVTVLPGSYLSRAVAGLNPGSGRVRMALVADLEACTEAAHRIRQFMQHHY